MADNNNNSWMNNPALSGIDPAKLQMLASLAEQAQKKDKSELMPFLMALSKGEAGAASGDVSDSRSPAEGTSGAPASGPISFDSAETEAIINVLKAGKSPQEIKKMDKILSVMKKIRK
ncbi:MAG: hypothetical protein LIO76_09940 [Clostridiales bacterium]|nr:hypothetical protein [Clostridiales bacterium]